MSLLKQLSLAAVFAASLFFVSDALADEKEKNPFTKEINAVKRAEKRLQKAKNNAARKRAETNLKKEKKALENAVKEETARYEKALKAVEEQLKLIGFALRTIDADSKVEYAEVKFFKKIRTRLSVSDAQILARYPEREDFLLPDIKSDDMDIWNNLSLPDITLI